MRNIWTIFKKELYGYFVSPIAYVVATVFLLLAGYFFFSLTAAFEVQAMHYMRYSYNLQDLNLNEMIMRPLFYNVSIILLLMMPMLTMRMYTEERRSGTLEVLLTAPITNFELIMGKFIACFFLFFVMLLATASYSVILFLYGNPELGPILSAYLGLLLMGSVYIALGSFISSFTENQVVAGLITFGVLLFLWIIGWASNFVGERAGAFLSYISIIDHYENFAKGIIDSKSIVFYLSFIFFGLFLTNRALEFK